MHEDSGGRIPKAKAGTAAPFAPGNNDGLVNIKLPRQDVDARIYKIVDGVELQLHIFYPKGYFGADYEPFPVAASFHGGSWREGPIEWGYADAEFMASLGFVGMAVQYRLADYAKVSALECIKDANSAVRWIRMNHKDINADPNAVFVIGHSAGAHLALCTAFFSDFKQSSESDDINSIPNAVIALAPAVSLDNDQDFQKMLLNQISAKDCSPSNNIQLLEVPVLVIHGTKDESLDIAGVREFTRKMKEAGNDIELKEYVGGDHVFFYGDPEGMVFWHECVRQFVGAVLTNKQALSPSWAGQGKAL